MPTAHEIVDLLGRHASPHFVVDIKAAKEEMENPLRDFKTVLSDQTVSQWHFYALEGLRSIAAESSISPEDGQIII